MLLCVVHFSKLLNYLLKLKYITMTVIEAKRKMTLIEKHLKSLKGNGFRVHLIDNDKMVLESPLRGKKNDILFDKAIDRQTKSGQAYGSPNLTLESATANIEYDYEIYF